MSAFVELVRRDLVLAARDGGAVGTALGFYVIVVALLLGLVIVYFILASS